MSPAAARRSRSTTSQLSPDVSHWDGFHSLLQRAMNPGPRVRAIASVRPRSLPNNETCICRDSSVINAPLLKFSCPCGLFVDTGIQAPRVFAVFSQSKPRENLAPENPSRYCPDGPGRHCTYAHAEPTGGKRRACHAKSRVPRALAHWQRRVNWDYVLDNVSIWNLSRSRPLLTVGTCVHSGGKARKS